MSRAEAPVPVEGRLLPVDDTAAETLSDSHAASRLMQRLGVILVSHTAVDVYSAFVPPIIGVLQVRIALSDAQAAWLIGCGPLASGLSQPLSAWLSDRFDSRLFGMLGLIIAAVCLSSIGFADSFASLIALYGMGMIGVGIFHPIGASSMGQIAESARPGRRSLGISFFFVAGMAGGAIGSLLSPRITALPGGFLWLGVCMIPGVILAFLLHRAIRAVPHRSQGGRDVRWDRSEAIARWSSIALLYVGNAFRFTVNIALIYLLVRYAESLAAAANPAFTREQVAEAAAPHAGNLNAMMILGMAVGGMSAGLLVRPGREKLPLLLLPILASPAIALVPHVPPAATYVLLVFVGIGFASLVPVTMALGQRLLPHRTSLASGLMLGGAWAPAVLGPRLAELLMSDRGAGLGLHNTFLVAACTLAFSGLIAIPLRRTILERNGR